MLTEFIESIEEAEKEKNPAKAKRRDSDNVSFASSATAKTNISTASTVHTFKSDLMSVGTGSTYTQKAKLVNYTAASIPAAYVKLTVWFFCWSSIGSLAWS